MRDANLTWQKGTKQNPRKNEEYIEKRNKELAALLKKRYCDIEAERLVVYALDECHLQGDEICGYVWGDKQEREIVYVENDRARQTYYGALNIWTNEFIVIPYSSGNGDNTVNFVEHIKNNLHPKQQVMFIWDGASYHKGECMKSCLAKYNDGLSGVEWPITCELFAPYAPEENPVEAIWLQVKNFIRRFYYICQYFGQNQADIEP